MRSNPSILVPTDFSDGSHAATQLALDLARRLGGRVTLLHVFRPPTPVGPEGIPGWPELVGAMLGDARAALGRDLATAQAGGLSVEGRITEGAPAEEIVKEAKAHDLVVIGTHGRTGLSHLLLGSVAERVVRTSGAPVLTVRRPG